MLSTIILYVASLGGASLLWSGLSIIIRKQKFPQAQWWQNPTVFTGISFIIAIWYLAGIGLETTSTTKAIYLFWDRLTWWPILVGGTFWLGAWFQLRIVQPQPEFHITPNPDAAWRVDKVMQKGLLILPQKNQETEVQKMIQTEVDSIFRHSNFHKDQVLAESKLLRLTAVQQALLRFTRRNGLFPSQLSDSEKARVLRQFLTEFVQQLSPQLEEKPAVPLSDNWLAYMILYHSYVERCSRQEVIGKIYELSGVRLAGRGKNGGRAYALHLGNGRSRLTHLLLRDEIKAQNALRNEI